MSTPRHEDTYHAEFFADPKNRLEYHGEALVLEVSEALQYLVEELGISRTELAQRLFVTKGAVTQALSGGKNMTIRTLGKLCYALNSEVQFEFVQLGSRGAAKSNDASGSSWDAAPLQPRLHEVPWQGAESQLDHKCMAA